jgi:hypothetical protein
LRPVGLERKDTACDKLLEESAEDAIDSDNDDQKIKDIKIEDENYDNVDKNDE